MTTFCTVLYLNRFAYLPYSTLGRLTGEILTAPSICTLEKPWIKWLPGPGGDPDDSCVPDGEYTLVPHNSQRHSNSFKLVNPLLGVYPHDKPKDQKWGRDQILIHIANYVHQVKGCIAVGTTFTWNIVPEAMNSRVAMDRLRDALRSVGFSNESPAKLIIQPSKGTGTQL